jgi:hypothetical protein
MTELEAVNIMLSVIGEAPVDYIEGVTDSDVVVAKNILSEARRELCLQPWKFNTEYDYEIPFDDTFTWTEPDSTTTDIYVWFVPADLNSFMLSSIPEQIGSKHLDLVQRQAKQYVTGAPATKPLVFYDRNYNRDGLDQSLLVTSIWIDAIWDQPDFTYLPETAKRLLSIISANRFAGRAVGSEKLVRFSERDLMLAQRAFLKDQAPHDRRNVFLQPDLLAAMGRRNLNLERRYAAKTQRRP